MKRYQTRRSFVKKSVVGAVAAANLALFSGLVNAAESYGSGCVSNAMKSEAVLDGEGVPLFFICWFDEPTGDCAGVCADYDEFGNRVLKQVPCHPFNSRTNSVVCDDPGPFIG